MYSGPEEAGRVGLSMQMFSAISSVSIAFVTSRIPEFGQLVARKEYSDMRRVFNRSAALSIVCMAMMVTAILVADFVSEELKLNIVKRILPFHQIVFLGSACIANHLVYVMSIYLRSHKSEPFVVLSIINAAFIAALNLIFVPRIGGQGAVNVFVLVSVFISLPLAAVIYSRFDPSKTLK
jgi:O-antigen/teichoic acid export membrane protein